MSLTVPHVGRSADGTSEFEHRVLEAGAGAEERDPVLPRDPDRGERAVLVLVRAPRQEPDPVELLQCLVRLAGRHPVHVEVEVVAVPQPIEQTGHPGVRANVRRAVADQGDASGVCVHGTHPGWWIGISANDDLCTVDKRY
jgi:hypothetical protein